MRAVNLPQPLIAGRFLRRLNRFAAEVRLEDEVVLAHVANSGRLGELLVERAEVRVHPVREPRRVTTHDLLLVRHDRVWVSIDSRAPAAIAAEAFRETGLSPIPRAEAVQAEVPLGSHRIDLRVRGRGRGEEWLVEVKGCTLVREGTALFPDAPTERGRRQVEALTRATEAGARAMVLFVIQREDARRFRPHEENDPALAEALRRAARAGVAIAAHRCHVSTREVTLAERVPVDL
jgi:sugar fermentation stimulation protein A